MTLGNEQVETIIGKAFELAQSKQIAMTAKSVKLGKTTLLDLLEKTIRDVRALKSAIVSGKTFIPEDGETQNVLSILSVPMRAEFSAAILENDQAKQVRVLLRALDIAVLHRLQPLMRTISGLAELKVEFFGY